MSNIGTKLGAAAAVLTVALSFATAPAQAHGWGGGYRSHGHHHHNHGYRHGGYAPHCFVVHKQFFDGYHYVSRPVTVCK